MSDSTQRRGTDYDTLRGMGAGAGSRMPRTADDPLEELARLVSQNEPVRPSAQAAAGEPRSTYTASPRAPLAAERFDAPPSFATRAPAPQPQPQAFESRDQQRAYGSPGGSSAQQGYGPSDDFFADLQPVAPRGIQNDHGGQNDYDYPPHADDFDAGYDSGFQARSPFQDNDFDDLPHPPFADGDELHDEAPVRRRGGVLVKLGGIAAALAVVLGGGVWAFGALTGTSSDNTPPVIKAESTTPVKVVPEAKPVVRAKESYDRVDPNANANVVTSVEEPGEKPTAPRVILPGASAQGTQERVTENTTASLASAPPAAASEAEQGANGHRRVKTLVIRADGSAAPAEQPSSSVQALAAPEPPPSAPTPIQGTGEAAGMSMQPARDFGIMTSEPAPPQQTASVAEVPMPMPRPSLAEAPPAAPAAAAPTAQNDPFARQDAAPQRRAATQTPAPQAGGPPSSPQPQVQVTNKRPLKPASAPGRQSAAPSPTAVAAASPAAQPRPAAPAAQAAAPRPVAVTPAPTQSARPTQVAMASPVPTGSSAAPQIAAVATSSGGAFGVQLTAQRTEQEAIAAFNAIKGRNPGVLANYNPAIARADLGPDRGVFYRAMVPAANQSDAANLCIQFKAAGVDCIVQRR